MTLDQIFKEFIFTKETTLKAHTVKIYISAYNKYIAPIFSISTLDNINYISYSFVLGHSSTEITKRYVTYKPQIAKKSIDILFDDLKNKGDRYVENLNAIINMGESVEKILFSAEKLKKINN